MTIKTQKKMKVHNMENIDFWAACCQNLGGVLDVFPVFSCRRLQEYSS